MYKSLNEFEIRPDATTGFHGNHSYKGENVVSTLAPSLCRGGAYWFRLVRMYVRMYVFMFKILS